MKHIRIIMPALAMLTLASCADDNYNDFRTAAPDSGADYEYLNEYGDLKTYVDRTKYPNFKLAGATDAASFNNKELVYALDVANYDEVVTGNAFKYASCVADDGTMDFSTVSEFTNNAIDAGLLPYGHTLVWHSQQNNKYLGNLIADKEIEVDPNAKVDVEDASIDYTSATSCGGWASDDASSKMSFSSDGMKISNPVACTNFWDLQYIVLSGIPTVSGNTYKVTMMIKGSTDGTIKTVKLGDWGGGDSKSLNFSSDWEEVSIELTASMESSFLMLQHGDFVGDLWIKNIRVTHSETPVMTIVKSVITNGDAEGDDVSCFFSTEKTDGPKACTIGAAGTGADGVGHAFVVESGDNPTNSWDTQFFLRANRVLKEGEQLKLSFKYRADIAASSESQTHSEPGSYIYWNGGAAVNFTTDWQTFDKTITISSDMAGSNGMQTFAWNLNVLGTANKYYFDDIVFGTEEAANTLPMTDEEKKDTLIWAMDNWIKGIMTATGGNVKAWDVVNEPIGGSGDDGNGNYALQHASNPDDNGVSGDVFYWQDYLGDLDFVRIAVAKARQYFEEAGGNPSELKLFVNDYNLESDWDDNKKVKSMINWIAKWEADGVTKIDGIGTQMHISCYANETTQASKKEHITKMFELLAASGKLIRVSELDMGYIDANGNSVKTVNMTEEAHHAMADLYKFVVSEYLRIIPADQQWGICNWGVTDSPETSYWRAGEPIGLWDVDYHRKHTYAGFADGLSGK